MPPNAHRLWEDSEVVKCIIQHLARLDPRPYAAIRPLLTVSSGLYAIAQIEFISLCIVRSQTQVWRILNFLAGRQILQHSIKAIEFRLDYRGSPRSDKENQTFAALLRTCNKVERLAFMTDTNNQSKFGVGQDMKQGGRWLLNLLNMEPNPEISPLQARPTFSGLRELDTGSFRWDIFVLVDALCYFPQLRSLGACCAVGTIPRIRPPKSKSKQIRLVTFPNLPPLTKLCLRDTAISVSDLEDLLNVIGKNLYEIKLAGFTHTVKVSQLSILLRSLSRGLRSISITGITNLSPSGTLSIGQNLLALQEVEVSGELLNETLLRGMPRTVHKISCSTMPAISAPKFCEILVSEALLARRTLPSLKSLSFADGSRDGWNDDGHIAAISTACKMLGIKWSYPRFPRWNHT